MKQLFKIDESEKRRILEMHEKATRKNYLNEQNPPPAEPSPRQAYVLDGITYKLPAVDSEANYNIVIGDGNLAFEDRQNKEAGQHVGLYATKLRKVIAQDTADNSIVCNKQVNITQNQRQRAFEDYKKSAEPLGLDPADYFSHPQLKPGETSLKQFAGIRFKMNAEQGYNELERKTIQYMSDAIKKIPNACQA